MTQDVPSMQMTVLILDPDFFTTKGGGQVFYRRLVERNPGILFYYPSLGPDLSPEVLSRLPENAVPFPFDYHRALRIQKTTELPPALADTVFRLVGIAVALQGMHFEAVDIPSFRPIAHLVRPILEAFGISIGRVALSYLGWNTSSIRSSYAAENTPALQQAMDVLLEAEHASAACADVRYVISELEKAQESRGHHPVLLLDMHDTLETVPVPDPEPPGEGPPDLWFVGRLDGAKGPDIFLELVARIPRDLYGACRFAGPDNLWDPVNRWSRLLLEQARELGIEAEYVGTPSDEEVRQRVYGGRSVVVVPSRNDSFNYVALEALLHGCPLLLSTKTGAAGFLQKSHPHLLPPLMDPEALDAAAASLADMLRNYDTTARNCRAALRRYPPPTPGVDFMVPIYRADPTPDQYIAAAKAEIARTYLRSDPLLKPCAFDWRPGIPAAVRPDLSLIVPMAHHSPPLAPLLAALARQKDVQFEILVTCDDPVAFAEARRVAGAFALPLRVHPGFARAAPGALALNSAVAEARGRHLAVADLAWRPSPDWAAVAVNHLDHDAVAVEEAWLPLKEGGYERSRTVQPASPGMDGPVLAAPSHGRCVAMRGTAVKQDKEQKAIYMR